ncbi:MAG: hypothetical protein IJA36_08635 [Lachnospiraceae bacterium]|nr:hypothetical protein [Lachnospiraceae bacterium]
MFRVWAKIWKENKLIEDTVIEDGSEDTRTHKIFHALEKACYEFDLSVPIWLDSNVEEFKRVAKTRFKADNFVEGISFDFLEFQIIEEDY